MKARERLWPAVGFCCLVLVALPVAAQDEGHDAPAPDAAMMEAWQKSMTPGAQHEALASEVGTWTMTVKTWMDPSAPPMESSGTAERSMIMDGRVLVEEVEATMMGTPFRGTGRTGYDNVTGTYWSDWIDNMSTGVTLMKGSWEGDTGTFVGETSDPMTGERAKMKVVIHNHGDDKQVSEFYMPGPTGEMIQTMEITYVRQ